FLYDLRAKTRHSTDGQDVVVCGRPPRSRLEHERLLREHRQAEDLAAAESMTGRQDGNKGLLEHSLRGKRRLVNGAADESDDYPFRDQGFRLHCRVHFLKSYVDTKEPLAKRTHDLRKAGVYDRRDVTDSERPKLTASRSVRSYHCAVYVLKKRSR